jgi:hypothetical protein
MGWIPAGDLVQQLLEECNSYVVKRLFLYLARKFDLAFLKHVDLKKVDLGHLEFAFSLLHLVWNKLKANFNLPDAICTKIGWYTLSY